MSGSTGWKLVLLMSSALLFLFFLRERVTLALGAVYSRGMRLPERGGLSGAYLAYFRSIRVWFKMLFFFFSSFRDLAQQQTER